MFLPAILIENVQNDMTRFIVGAMSITQLIYLSKVGGVILGSKIFRPWETLYDIPDQNGHHFTDCDRCGIYYFLNKQNVRSAPRAKRTDFLYTFFLSESCCYL